MKNLAAALEMLSGGVWVVKLYCLKCPARPFDAFCSFAVNVWLGCFTDSTKLANHVGRAVWISWLLCDENMHGVIKILSTGACSGASVAEFI
ncbi:MAG: hypothetical protein LBH04_01555 [Tannerellaceae bacterium]|nr:hypothetical protein [Tannerellaceae bacterium]